MKHFKLFDMGPRDQFSKLGIPTTIQKRIRFENAGRGCALNKMLLGGKAEIPGGGARLMAPSLSFVWILSEV